MSRKLKILTATVIAFMILASIVTFSLIVANFFVQTYFPEKGHVEGEWVDGPVVSPTGRWEVNVYVISFGAITSTYYARFTDTTGKAPAKDILLPSGRFQKLKIRWKNENVVNIFGIETNALTGTVLDAISISPNGKWKVKLYYYPVTDGRRSWDGRLAKYYNYAVVTDLKGKSSSRKIKFVDKYQIHKNIRWSSANIIDVYGVPIDVRKGIVYDKLGKEEQSKRGHDVLSRQTKQSFVAIIARLAESVWRFMTY